MGTSRRAILAAAAAGFTATQVGCDNPPRPNPRAGTLRTVVYLTAYGKLGQDAYMIAGKENGLFADEGIDLQIKGGNGTEQNLKLLASNAAQFATVDLTGLMIAYGKRMRGFACFFAVYQRPVSAMVAKASSGITRPPELAGRRIGYTVGGVNRTLFPLYAKLSGIDERAIVWHNVAQAPQLRQVLAADLVDAITETVIGKAGTQAMVKQPVTVLPYSDVLTDLYSNAIAVTDHTAGADPELVRAFRRAASKSMTYALDHPAEAAAVFHRINPSYPTAAAEAEIRLMGPYVQGIGGAKPGSFDRARTARAIAVLQSGGLVPDAFDPNEVVAFDLAT